MKRGKLAVAVAATALLIPSAAGAASDASVWPVEPICVGQAVTTDGRTMSLYVTLTAVPPPVPAVPHRAWCEVYVNGSHIGTVQGDHVGFVIAGVGEFHDLPVGVYSFCAAREGGWAPC